MTEPCRDCWTPVVAAAADLPVKRLRTTVSVTDGQAPTLIGRHDALKSDQWLTAPWYEVDLNVELDHASGGYDLTANWRPHTPDRCRSLLRQQRQENR